MVLGAHCSGERGSLEGKRRKPVAVARQLYCLCSCSCVCVWLCFHFTLLYWLCSCSYLCIWFCFCFHFTTWLYSLHTRCFFQILLWSTTSFYNYWIAIAVTRLCSSQFPLSSILSTCFSIVLFGRLLMYFNYFLDALASLGSMLESQSLTFLRFCQILGISSGYLQGMFRVCS